MRLKPTPPLYNDVVRFLCVLTVLVGPKSIQRDVENWTFQGESVRRTIQACNRSVWTLETTHERRESVPTKMNKKLATP